MKKKITNKDGWRGLSSVQYWWKALKAFFSKTFKKSQSRCASSGVPQIVVGKKASRINSLHVHVSIRFFIHHQVVLPEERRIMAKKKSFCLFMLLYFDSGIRCWLLTRSASCLPFALLLVLLTLLAYTIIPIKIALFLLIQNWILHCSRTPSRALGVVDFRR